MFPWASDSPLYAYLILPLAIFCARVLDVSIGTIRVILLGRGMRVLAPLLGFVEVTIWLLAISQIMRDLTNWVYVLAYAGGFATGNYVGMFIEGRLAIGLSMVRVVAPGDTARLRRFLRRAGFRVTSTPATGAVGPVEIIFTVIPRRRLQRVEEIIRRCNPHAFYTIEDVRFVSQAGGRRGAPLRSRAGTIGVRRLIPRRKGK